MKRIKATLILLFFIVITIEVQSQFQKTYGFKKDDIGQVLLKANDTTLYLIGAYGYVSQIDTAGNIVWEKEMYQNDPYYGNIISDAIKTDSLSFVVLANKYYARGDDESIFITEINSIGDILWTKSYGKPFRFCKANRIIRTKDKGFAIIGNGSGDLLLIKTDSIGNLLWSKTYGGESDDKGVCLVETQVGDFILVGETLSFGEGGKDIFILKINSTGDILWTKTIGGNRNDYPSDLIRTTSNEYVLTGTTSSYDEYYHDDDLFLLKFNGEGNIIWYSTYGGNNDERSGRLIQTNDNQMLVIGGTKSFGFGQEDIFLLKIDQLGDTIFTKVYGGSSDENGKYISNHSNGYYLLGETRSFSVGEKDMCVIYIDNNGNSTCRYKSSNTTISTPVWRESAFDVKIKKGCEEEIVNITLAEVSIQVNNMCECLPPKAKFQTSTTDCLVEFTDLSTWVETWLWDFGNGNISNEQNNKFLFGKETKVCLTVQNSCGTDTYCDTVNGGVGIEDRIQSSLIKIFPNPTDGIIYIECENDIKISSIVISDLSGNDIFRINNPHQNKQIINVKRYSGGTYLIKVLTNDDKMITQKMIFKK